MSILAVDVFYHTDLFLPFNCDSLSRTASTRLNFSKNNACMNIKSLGYS